MPITGANIEMCIYKEKQSLAFILNACNTYEEFKKHVEGYYSKRFDEVLLKKLYENGMLSETELTLFLR